MSNSALRLLMIGAHPGDCDFCCGGTALQYVQAGHLVKFLSLTDGRGGHQTMPHDEIAARRLRETQEVAKFSGIEYDVWDVPDCCLEANMENRLRLIRAIRAFSPDVIFCCRPNDYHADHRACSLLVRDVSYLLIVPTLCPDSAAMRRMPLVMHYYNDFENPPFSPDIIIEIDNVINMKYEIIAMHASQVFEWLPYTQEREFEVPEDDNDRMEWLRSPRLPRDDEITDEKILAHQTQGLGEYWQSLQASKYRQNLVDRYGIHGKTVRFAESFSVSEYGAKLTWEKKLRLFPF